MFMKKFQKSRVSYYRVLVYVLKEKIFRCLTYCDETNLEPYIEAIGVKWDYLQQLIKEHSKFKKSLPKDFFLLILTFIKKDIM